MNTERATELVLSDIVALKTMSAEIVVRLSLDAIANNPLDPTVTEQGRRHIEEELAHIGWCQEALRRRGCAFVPPFLHVRLFSAALRSATLQPFRSSTFVAATVLCTAIEASALPVLSAVLRDGELHDVFARIGRDELDHYATVSARWLARQDGVLERLWNVAMSLILGSIAVLVWWPYIAPAYRVLGLRPDVFAEALVSRLSANFRIAGAPVCRRALRYLVLRSTTIGDASNEGPECLPV